MQTDNKTSSRKVFVSKCSVKKSCLPAQTCNIFATNDDVAEHNTELDNLSEHHIIGDRQFRTKLLGNRTNKTLTSELNNLSICAPSPFSLTQQSMKKSRLDTSQLTTKNCNRLIQISELHYLGRCRKANDILQKYKQGWNQFEKTLHKKYGKSLRKQSQVRVFVQDNPQKDDLIRDAGCQYWRKSLRSNDKSLLKYFQGVPRQRKDVLRLLQTAQGQRILKQSVPYREGRAPNKGFSVQATDFQNRKTLSLNSGASRYIAQQVLCSNWKNKNLSRLYHQF